MQLYTLAYPFESSGGNVQYQTTQRVEREAETANVDATVVTTGLSIEDDAVHGTAVVELDEAVTPEAVFESATEIRRVAFERETGRTEQNQASVGPGPELRPDAIAEFENRDEVAEVLAVVNETPGRGVLFDATLQRCDPAAHDAWLVRLDGEATDAESDLTRADVVGFYRQHLDRFREDPTLKIVGFHGSAENTIRLGLVATVVDPQQARALAEQTGSPSPTNVYRLELSKAALIVGASTHGPGEFDAVFRDASGDEITSREVAYRTWLDGLDASYHPLGLLVDGDLYRPVTAELQGSGSDFVGDPIVVDTYRGSRGTPWQFGVTRSDDQIFLTQARAGPEKFDPVLKRFQIERQPIGEEPLLFSHTVSRRIWSEDPVNVHVQSNRSEGLVTQFLYADGDGWHLLQPDGLGETADSTDSEFESTQLDGVSVRSSILRADTGGESKTSVEHEYRVTADVFDACNQLYVLSYHEVSEESIDRLQWDVADATAYEIVGGREES